MTTIIFSRNRAAQLDLLLNSGRRFAPDLFDDAHVLWRSSDEKFTEAYQACIRSYPNISFYQETEFSRDLFVLLARIRKHVMFLCDDDVFYRPLKDPFPTTILDWCPEVLTVSLRLGMNTTRCYSLNVPQGTPYFKNQQRHSLAYEWRGLSGDWGYPGSLDGNVWRGEDLKVLIDDQAATSPNDLEDILALACSKTLTPNVACYEDSILVGVPVNMVNGSHRKNRCGDFYPQSVESLNAAYLDGFRLSHLSINPGVVRAAHCEQQLVFLGKESIIV